MDGWMDIKSIKAFSTFEEVHIHTITVTSTETLLLNCYLLSVSNIVELASDHDHVFLVSPQDGRLNQNKPLQSPNKSELAR